MRKLLEVVVGHRSVLTSNPRLCAKTIFTTTRLTFCRPWSLKVSSCSSPFSGVIGEVMTMYFKGT